MREHFLFPFEMDLFHHVKEFCISKWKFCGKLKLLLKRTQCLKENVNNQTQKRFAWWLLINLTNFKRKCVFYTTICVLTIQAKDAYTFFPTCSCSCPNKNART
uniref:Uncharacterized protein n=1 Tax=Micrurus spixii TaxID=129469 RepID=A0A2D4MSJ8_9SAUR